MTLIFFREKKLMCLDRTEDLVSISKIFSNFGSRLEPHKYDVNEIAKMNRNSLRITRFEEIRTYCSINKFLRQKFCISFCFILRTLYVHP